MKLIMVYNSLRRVARQCLNVANCHPCYCHNNIFPELARFNLGKETVLTVGGWVLSGSADGSMRRRLLLVG